VRPESEHLRRQLRENERIWSGFRRIELDMMAAESLCELIDALTSGLTRRFPRVNTVSLAWMDPQYETARLLQRQGGAALIASGIFVPLASAERLEQVFGPPRGWQPRLGVPDPAVSAWLFPRRPPPASVALAPLVLRHRLVGCLNQGSEDPLHFTPETATDLLEHLAAVTALCLDNALNHERLRLDGLTDPLTQVANRRFFERRLEEEVQRWRRHQRPLACLLVDVDHFKRINDRYGHPRGDAVLKAVAELLGRDRRASDVLARYGGEEFVLLLPDTTLEQARCIAERIRARVAQAAMGPQDDAGLVGAAVTVSIGVAVLDAEMVPDAQEAGARLLAQADAALLQAKRLGRNRVVLACGGGVPGT
jgi:diguanylate cyclase (GGDEF)-like protein